MTKRLWLLLFLGASCALLWADLILSENGRTGYRIVINRTLPPDELAVATELAQYLRKITGAEFPVAEADAPFAQTTSTSGAIYIDWPASGDNTPLTGRPSSMSSSSPSECRSTPRSRPATDAST